MSTDLDAERKRIQDLYPHVQVFWLPSPSRYKTFEDWVMWEDGCDDSGNFLGWCPLHDKFKRVDGSAEFNFHKGVMRCQGDPRCHDKRAFALDNVKNAMLNDGE